MKISQRVYRNETQQIAEVETTEELVNLPWVKQHSKSKKFSQFSVSTSFPGHNLLIARYTDGTHWVIGYLQVNEGEKVNLPIFTKRNPITNII